MAYARKGRNFVFPGRRTEFSPPPRRLSRLAGLHLQTSATSDYRKAIVAPVIRPAACAARLERTAANRQTAGARPSLRVAPPGGSGDSGFPSAQRLASPPARRPRFALQVALLKESGDSRFLSAKRLGSPLPRRTGAVTAKRPERSGGAAQPLDGDGAAWPGGSGNLVKSRQNRIGIGGTGG
jgi:hypothetical protein